MRLFGRSCRPEKEGEKEEGVHKSVQKFPPVGNIFLFWCENIETAVFTGLKKLVQMLTTIEASASS